MPSILVLRLCVEGRGRVSIPCDSSSRGGHSDIGEVEGGGGLEGGGHGHE